MAMTQKQLETLLADEAALFVEWHSRWQEEHPDYPWFNEDGIVDPERWHTLPDGKRILLLLKETNDLHGSLTEFLRQGGSATYGRTWNNVARWAAVILYGEYWDNVPREKLNDIVRNLTIVNLKKYAGGASAKPHEIATEAAKDTDLLRKQITLYAPDIILTGGWGLVSNFLHDTIYQDAAVWHKPDTDTVLWYYKTDQITPQHKTLVISMPHPNRAAKRWTMELEKVLHVTKRV